jgi:hypothetical protein
MQGMGGSYHDGFLFMAQLKKEDISVPDELGISNDANCMLTFKGKKI